jgi:hypothetical protein
LYTDRHDISGLIAIVLTLDDDILNEVQECF